ncbi:MAG: hypothetical protein JXA66_04560, partial [Oligoflexia bacterium]|nr:hypothetical protein [Oligoflexia bacterium]
YNHGVFKIYDPNFPGNTTREVTYTYQGNWGIYNSGTSAASTRFQYNVFGIVGPSLFHNFNNAYDIYEMAELDPCFKDQSKFPTISLTAPTDTDHDGKLDVESTSENGTTLTGTITGGAAQPTHTVIYVNATKYDAAIAAGGAFSQKVPLFCTESNSSSDTINVESKDNIVEFLVTESNEWEKYAGFKRYIISCTGPTPLAKVTLTWSHTLDIDLHLTAPDATDIGYMGQNYQNQYDSTLPYLDFDDTTGMGPEHMFFNSDQSLDEGSYTVRVNYWSKKSYDTAPVVTYTVKVELGFMVDGVPVYEAPQYYTGTLSSVGDWATVTSFEYPPEATSKTLPEGRQGN